MLALVGLNAGWMVFDGARALVAGDYVTPRTGPYAGRLGPWSRVCEAVGLEPRSTLVKMIFVAYGSAYLLAAVGMAGGIRWARHAVAALAVLGLWYLPFGTLVNVLVLFLLARREPRSG